MVDSEICKFFHALSTTPSRLDKLRLLNSVKGDHVIAELFRLAYDPTILFYMTKVPEYRSLVTPQETLTSLVTYSRLDVLSSRKITGNLAKTYVASVLGAMEPAAAQIVVRVLKKDLQCGVAAKTVLQVWPTLFKLFEDMSCVDNLAAISFPCYAQTKLDGGKCVMINRGGNIICLSREGKPIEVHGRFDPLIENIPDGVQVEGELVGIGHDLKILPRTVGNGIINKAIRGTITEGEAELLALIAYDIRSSTKPYKGRLQDLASYVKAEPYSFFRLVDTEIMPNKEELFKFFDFKVSQGEEGVVVKNLYFRWHPGPNKSCVKLKAEYEGDFQVIGIKEGASGKAVGKIGSLKIATADGELECYVGSGLTDDDRAVLTESDIVGKIVRVTYNDIVMNKSGKSKHSLFLPRLKPNFIRSDKSEADTLKKLMEQCKKCR